MKLKIIEKRRYYYIFSGALCLISILALIAWGLKPGLDFTGGSLLEVSFSGARPQVSEIQAVLAPLGLGEAVVQPANDQDVILKFQSVSEEKHQEILSAISGKFTAENNAVKENRFDSIGPVIGKELLQKSWLMMLIASLAIIAYIGYAFRKVSKPLASWKYGVSAVIALIHDLLIVTGLFSILGHFYGIEVDSLFITALLTIMGFSVHDTIVVFDRTRENLSKFYSGKFDEVVNDSINQTLVRSINTSVTVLLVLLALFALGGDSTKNFTLALLFGIFFGTYSSIFVASSLIIDWNNWDKRVKRK